MTLQLGLTAAQLQERKTGFGGSNANTLLSGDDAKIMQMWLEFTNQAEPEDLSRVLPVQMGTFTEPLNRHWYTLTTGNEVTEAGAMMRHPEHAFMRCTLDGLVPAEGAIFEAKHVNQFSKIDAVAQKYMPQLHHNMAVCGLSRAVLSVFVGTMTYDVMMVEADPFYTENLIAAEAHFWDCVQTMTPPGDIAAPVAPALPTQFRTVDMTGNNAWGASAHNWLRNQTAAKLFKAADADIKSLVEFDVSEAFGHGIKCTRAKNGALTIREMKQ